MIPPYAKADSLLRLRMRYNKGTEPLQAAGCQPPKSLAVKSFKLASWPGCVTGWACMVESGYSSANPNLRALGSEIAAATWFRTGFKIGCKVLPSSGAPKRSSPTSGICFAFSGLSRHGSMASVPLSHPTARLPEFGNEREARPACA